MTARKLSDSIERTNFFFVGRKHIDDAVDGLRRRRSVQSA